MNSVQIMGNLARDPVVRATKTGRAVASFTVAVNRNFTNPQGEQREITDWINVVAWGPWAEAAGNQLRKGTRVFVEGRYTTRSYEAQDGTKRYVTEVSANLIAIPLSMAGGSSYGQQQPQGNSYGGNNGYNGNNNFGGNGGFGGNNNFGNNGGFGAAGQNNQPKGDFGQFGPSSKDEDIPF